MGLRSPSLKRHGDDFGWSLLDAAPDATLIAASTGEIVFVNDQAARMFGYELEDLLGCIIEDLLPNTLAAGHRAHRTRYSAAPTVRSMGGNVDLWAKRRDGTEFPVEISLSPLRLGDDVFAVAAVRDVTDRMAADERLRQVIRTLDASDDGVLIFDAETWRFTFVNDGAVRLLGYSSEELLTMTPLHLNPYTTTLEYRRLVDELLVDGPAVVRQSIMLAKSGTEVPVEKTFRSAPRARDGTRSVICLARDIRARLAAEAEARAGQAVAQAHADVVAIVEERERLARDLHGSVIEPLFTAGMDLQGTLSTIVDPGTRAVIQRTVAGLDLTVADLRKAVFALEGAGAAPGIRQQLLETVADATGKLGYEARLSFTGQVETITPAITEELTAVLRQLLDNIVRHAAASEVRVSVMSVDDDVTLTVTDDGIGLPPGALGGRGMTDIADRARRRRGEFTVDSRQPSGSICRWQVPLGGEALGASS